MAFFIGREREARRAYGFDEIALVPGNITINPNEVDTSWQIGKRKFRVPIIASAMDGVVDVKFAVAMSKLAVPLKDNAGIIDLALEYQVKAAGTVLGKFVKVSLHRPFAA